MKRFFAFALLLISTVAYGVEPGELEVKILERVFGDLTGKRRVKIFIVGSERDRFVKNIERFSVKIRTVDSCKDADLVFIAGKGKEFPEGCRGRLTFSTSREDILLVEECVGAFYWKKGRPHILLIKEKLQERGISLPDEYKRFIESLRSLSSSGGVRE